jgi:hypothetical protein
MAAAEFETVDEREVEFFCWRLHELLRADYAFGDALTLTTHLGVDLHLAIDLPRRGCPHATALRILL